MNKVDFEKKEEIQTADSYGITYSPDSKYLLFNNGRDIVVYDTLTSELQHTLKGHTNYINALTFSPCGKLLASGADDKSVIIYDFEQKTIKK